MKSNNNISMNAFSKTNVNKRRKKKTKPKQRQYKKNKVHWECKTSANILMFIKHIDC